MKAEAETRRGDAGGAEAEGGGGEGAVEGEIPAGPAAAAAPEPLVSHWRRRGGGERGPGRRPETAEGLTWKRRCWGDAIRMRRIRVYAGDDANRSFTRSPPWTAGSHGFRSLPRNPEWRVSVALGTCHFDSRVLGRFRGRSRSPGSHRRRPCRRSVDAPARLARVAEAASPPPPAPDDAAPYLAEGVARERRTTSWRGARRRSRARRPRVARPVPRVHCASFPRRVPPRAGAARSPVVRGPRPHLTEDGADGADSVAPTARDEEGGGTAITPTSAPRYVADTDVLDLRTSTAC